MRALLNSLCNIILMFYYVYHVYISLEKRWYQGCYGGMKIMCFYLLIIDLKVSLNVKMFFFLIMRALLNTVCNIILNVQLYRTI